jgi:hypothetical protein
MNDDFETRATTWLRERARPDAASLEAVRGSIDALPSRRRPSQRAWLVGAAAVVAVLAIGVSALFLSVQPNGTAPTIPGGPVPPDPAAFAGDARLAACFGAAGPVEFAFEMPHARDYQLHFAAMLLAPELDVDDPAFVVVFASDARPLVGGAGRPSAANDATASSDPNERWVCILVGDTPNLYENVDITGMRVDLGDETVPSPSLLVLSTPPPSSTPTLTPEPPPSVADEAPWRERNLVPSATVRTIVGPGHCGWESTVWMFINDKELYLRDPDGIFADVEVGAFLPDTALPSDAHDTGLSSNGRRLFTVPSGDAVYIQTSTGVERWPRSTDPVMGCA